MLPRCLFLLLPALLALPFPVRAEGSQSVLDVNLPRRCGVCHLEKIEAGDPARFNFLSLREADTAGRSGMCYSCHNGVVRDYRRKIWSGFQHRAVGSSPEVRPGAQASCGTCHDPHTQTKGVEGFMRFKKSTSVHCLGCHPGRNGRNKGEHPFIKGEKPGKVVAFPNCRLCHQVHQAAGRGLVNRSGDDQLCARCHYENPSRKGVGLGSGSHSFGGTSPSCRTCHRMHRAKQEKLVKDATVNNAVCRRCHTGESTDSRGQGNHPLDSDAVKCLDCHRMHNAATLSTSKALLAKKVEDLDQLCRKCHASLTRSAGEWNHPLDSTITNTTDGRIAKLRGYGGLFGGAKKVQCLSCHRVHNSPKGTANLLVNQKAICLYCHSDQNTLAPQTARSGTHPVLVKPTKGKIADSFVRAGGVIGRGNELICTTCHRVHHALEGTVGLVLPQKEYACTACHSDKSDIMDTSHNFEEAGAGGDSSHPEPCRHCHGSHGWSIPLDAIEIGTSLIDKVCWSCHGPEGSSPMAEGYGHTLGKTPSNGTGGRDLPLFWEDGRRLERGVTTCSTCHNVHRNPVEYLLRLEQGENRSDLCLGCHRRQEAVIGTKHDISRYFPKEKNQRAESAASTGSCGACHLAHRAGQGLWARTLRREPGDVGELAAFCSDCHRQGTFAQGKVVSERLHPPAEVINQRPDTTPVDCDGCHDPHVWNSSDPSNKGEFFVDGTSTNSFLVGPAGGQSQLCLTCHTDEAEIAGTKHDFSQAGKEGGALSAAGKKPGLCEACHSPHGGESRLMWSSPLPEEPSFGADTCLSCHGEGKAAFSPELTGASHPLGVTPKVESSSEFPLYLTTGRRYHRGKVSCGTCHNPHRWTAPDVRSPDNSTPAGPTTSFLRKSADGFSPLCFPCHANRSMIVGTDHDLRVTAPESTNLDGMTAEKSGICGSCHRVHGAPFEVALWNRTEGVGEDPQSRYCRGCHDEGKMIEATVPFRKEVHLVAYPGKGLVSRPFRRKKTSLLDLSETFSLFSREGEKTDEGFISCATCHDSHRWEPGASRSGTGEAIDGEIKNSFLKVINPFSIGRSICRECHHDEALQMYRIYHFPGKVE